MATELLRRVGITGRFFAAHYRLGDYMAQYHKTPPVLPMLKKLKSGGALSDDVVYIATDSPDKKKYFRTVYSNFKKVIFASDLDADLISSHMVKFGSASSQKNFFGIIEQLICIAATAFAPTTYSTFSKTIEKMRQDQEKYFPEAYAARVRDGLPYHNGKNGNFPY